MSCNRLRLVSLLYQSCDHRDLHSFPTRRSSDLILYESGVVPEPFDYHDDRRVIEFGIGLTDLVKRPTKGVEELKREDFAERSEEHTSELQSHSDLVCRLLLEKKKTRTDDGNSQA